MLCARISKRDAQAMCRWSGKNGHVFPIEGKIAELILNARALFRVRGCGGEKSQNRLTTGRAGTFFCLS